MNLRHHLDTFQKTSAGPSVGRQSARPAAYTSVVLAAVLAIVALADQLGPGNLGEHADAIYASDGVDASPAVLYGLLYAVSAIAVILWLCVVRTTRARSRWMTPLMSGTTVAVNVSLALTLLFVSEYDARIYPSLWGLLALLPAVSGSFALIRSAGGRTSLDGRAT